MGPCPKFGAAFFFRGARHGAHASANRNLFSFHKRGKRVGDWRMLAIAGSRTKKKSNAVTKPAVCALSDPYDKAQTADGQTKKPTRHEQKRFGPVAIIKKKGKRSNCCGRFYFSIREGKRGKTRKKRMALKRTIDDKTARNNVRPRGMAGVFAGAGVLCLLVAAIVFALWYDDSLGRDMALEARIARAECLVLDRPAPDPTVEPSEAPRVRFYAVAAHEWIESTLSRTLGSHQHNRLTAWWTSFSMHHPPGDDVPCYYDPDDPGAAVALSPYVDGLRDRVLACAMVVGVLWVTGVVALAIAVADAIGCVDAHRRNIIVVVDDDGQPLSFDLEASRSASRGCKTPSRGWASRWRILDAALAG
ncbi:hypothetical protein psal_cds_477 [Pandoravirus salinus]|uniref:DUF3592 domain-containing protein n=1 Tax=Pandoravirus salinus TaxID=1349410 RepID=S4VXR5_9VIRU|nr:hypothetical protein psal_cds_477 [Pandoravirus salinus]AGO84251.1 hypothetical protein psal_cds_477 [Pandoravirus salinus]